jgi:hypothetical protein
MVKAGIWYSKRKDLWSKEEAMNHLSVGDYSYMSSSLGMETVRIVEFMPNGNIIVKSVGKDIYTVISQKNSSCGKP